MERTWRNALTLISEYYAFLFQRFTSYLHHSSIVKWSYPDNFKHVYFLFYFFWGKDFTHKNTSHLEASSIVKWGYPDNFRPAYYFVFWGKDFTHKNTSHLEVYAHMKKCCLCCLVLAYFCFVSWFLLAMCFCAQNLFLKKKKKKKNQWFWIKSLLFSLLPSCFPQRFAQNCSG